MGRHTCYACPPGCAGDSKQVVASRGDGSPDAEGWSVGIESKAAQTAATADGNSNAMANTGVDSALALCAASLKALFAKGEPQADGYDLNRRTWYLGAWIWHTWYPEWRLRLIRRGAARWGGMDPHAALDFTGKAARLKGDLLHYSFRDLQDHLQRTIGYARTMAASYAASGRKFHWHQLLLSPWVAVAKHLVLKGGWRDGWRGWIISIVRGVDCFAKYAFLLEHERVGASSATQRVARK